MNVANSANLPSSNMVHININNLTIHQQQIDTDDLYGPLRTTTMG
jgi:hypothetical protein